MRMAKTPVISKINIFIIHNAIDNVAIIVVITPTL
jgi:hypothetical protein